jgi:hypothetical protein
MALLRRCLAELRSKLGEADDQLVECGHANTHDSSARLGVRADGVSRDQSLCSNSMSSAYLNGRARPRFPDNWAAQPVRVLHER